MKGEQFSSIKFEELEFPRYVKVKESIEGLTRIIDFEQVKQDGVDRVLHAILQLIDENDDKTVDEKREEIEDAIYNGNVFKHYFNEKNKSKAVEVLSRTSILNDEERLIYIINFFMPGDINFTSTYSKNDKNIERIADYYGLSDENSNNLVFARISEISKFYKSYQEEKERQRIQTLAAMQVATEEPSTVNIESARMLLDNLSDASLRETLEQQLQALEQEESIPEVVEASLETEEELIPDELGEEIVIEESPVSEEVTEETLSELELESVETFEPIEQSEQPSVTEPALLDSVLAEHQGEETEKQVGMDVMASLQALVSGAKNNAQRVEQLSLDLELKDGQIAELYATIDSQQQELNEKNNIIKTKDEELEEKDRRLEEQSSKLVLLNSELEARDVSLNEANSVIESQKEEIRSLTTSLQAYKTSLGEIQNFLTTAQYGVEIDENPRKVA